MAKSGITPVFELSKLNNYIDGWRGQIESKEIEVLKRIGERFVNDAKNKGEYTDRTSDLRSSIGYILLNNGAVVTGNYESGKTAKGREMAKKATKKLAQMYPVGYVLIGFAGMEYAAAVESKNFDVITGSAPTRETMKAAFNKFL